MFTRDETILVAVSGGKDSLALWDVLIDDGYRTTGLYLDLGIFDYSDRVAGQVRGVRGRRGVPTAASSAGWPTRWARRCPVVKQATRRPTVLGLRALASAT